MQQRPSGSPPPRSFLGNLGDSVTAGVKSYGRWAAALPSRWARAFAFVGPAVIVVLALSAIGNAFGSGGSPAPQVVLLAAATPAPTLAVTREVVATKTVVAVAETPVLAPPTVAAPALIPATPVPTAVPQAQQIQSAVQNFVPAAPTQVVSAPNLPLVAPPTPRPPTPVFVPPTLTPRPPVVAPTTAPATSGGNCSPSYPTVCIPPAPPDLNCKDIPYRKFKVLPPDPHGFDSDHDGIGCES